MLETITNQLKPITKDRLTLKEVTELLDTKNFFASSDYHIFKYIKSLPNTLPAQDARVNPNFMVDIHNSTVKDNDIFSKEHYNKIIQDNPQLRRLNEAFIAGANSQIDKAKEKFCEVCDVKICSKMHVKCAEFIEFCKLIESC